jgi:hypothetical protein
MRSKVDKTKAFCRYCQMELEPHRAGLENHSVTGKHEKNAKLRDQALIVDYTRVNYLLSP